MCNVRRWRAQEESLNAQVADGNKKKMRLEGGGRRPLDADMEEMQYSNKCPARFIA